MSISDPNLIYFSALPMRFCTGSSEIYIYIEGSWAFGLWACDAGWGWTSFSGFLQSLAHAAGCSNSSDTHAQERRFSAAWSLTGSDYTWGNKQHILKPFQEILKITQHNISKTQIKSNKETNKTAVVFFQLVLKTKEFKDYTTQITKTQIKTIKNHKTKNCSGLFSIGLEKKH